MNFAGSGLEAQSDTLIGRFPETVAHQETEFLVDALDASLEIVRELLRIRRMCFMLFRF